MSKSEKSVILPAEGDGWEVWGPGADSLEHVASLDGAVTKATADPGSCVAFSACRVATMPLLVPSAENDLCRGAAQLELERAGLLLDGENYRGWDYVAVESSSDQTFISALYLLEEELNSENDLRHYSFDYSARFYRPNTESDCIALWKERHSWVLVLYRKQTPFLIEPIGHDLSQLVMSTRLAVTQLALKGIHFNASELFLWSTLDDQHALADAAAALNLRLHAHTRPIPQFPKSTVSLQPSTVTAWESRVQRRKKIRIALVAVAALYLVAALVLWGRFFQQDQKIADLKEQVARYTPAWERNQDHLSAWEEITPIVDPNWPLNVYKECVMSIPPGQPIRFEMINIQPGAVSIKGSAIRQNVISPFSSKLKNSSVFEGYRWEFPQARQSTKTTLWEFDFNAKQSDLTVE